MNREWIGNSATKCSPWAPAQCWGLFRRQRRGHLLFLLRSSAKTTRVHFWHECGESKKEKTGVYIRSTSGANTYIYMPRFVYGRSSPASERGTMLEGQDKEEEEGKWHGAASTHGPPMWSVLLELLPALVLCQSGALSGQAPQLFGSVWKFCVFPLPSCRAQCCFKLLLGKLICWSSFSSFFHFLIPFHISYLSSQTILWALQSCCLYLDSERGRQRQDVAFPCVCFSSPVWLFTVETFAALCDAAFLHSSIVRHMIVKL